MTVETLLFAALSAAAGWVARHYGVLAPVQGTPQPSQGAGGTSSPGPVEADLPSMIASIVSEEVRKGVARLEAKLLPASPSASSPQPKPIG